MLLPVQGQPIEMEPSRCRNGNTGPTPYPEPVYRDSAQEKSEHPRSDVWRRCQSEQGRRSPFRLLPAAQRLGCLYQDQSRVVSDEQPSAGSGAFDQYTSGISLNQNILDFGKTSEQVDISKYNLESSRSDLNATQDAIILSVKQAYYGVLQGQEEPGRGCGRPETISTPPRPGKGFL